MQPQNTLASQDESTAAPGELERLSSAIAYVHELAARLKSKLALVSVEKDLQGDVAKTTEAVKPHISNLIDGLNAANAKLETLLHDIVL